MGKPILELSFKKQNEIIPEVARFVGESAAKLGLSEKKSRFLCITIEAALEMRMSQINEDNPEVTLSIEDNGSCFKFTIKDLGEPYILTENQQRLLNKKLVDRYSFEQNGRNGQCISFVYRYNKNKAPAEVQVQEEVLLDENFAFGPVANTDEAVLEAVKCLYGVYGYEYFHQAMYSVEGFRKYMANGRYIPIIAKNEHGQAMCYCALDENEWFLGVPEFGYLVTKDAAKGRGLANQAFVEAENIARDMKYEGVHVSAVAYHPYTQKMCNKWGYTPSAVEYSINPAGTGGYGDGEDRRLDCVIAIKIFNKDRHHDLYLSPECNKIFKMIFDPEGVKYTIHNDAPKSDATRSVLSYFVDTDTDNCFMKIDECGKNFRKEMQNILSKSEVMNCKATTINLNINHPSAIAGYKTLRELGFICTGSIPGCKNGDFMLLQSFAVEPEYDKIVLEDNYKEFEREIRELNGI